MTTTNCQRCLDLLDDLLSSELLVETSQEILRHLTVCEICRGEYERRQNFRQVAKRALTVAVPPSLGTRILARIAEASVEPEEGAHSGEFHADAATGDEQAGVPGARAVDRKLHDHGVRSNGALRVLVEQRLQRFPSVASVSVWKHLAAAAVVVLVMSTVAILILTRGSSTLSAAQVLERADARLADIVTPGKVYYRRWHSTGSVRQADGYVKKFDLKVEEWAEGTVPGRVASRTHLPDGRLMSAGWTVLENGARRRYLFLNGAVEGAYVGKPFETKNRLLIFFTQEELQRELAAYPESERALLSSPLAVEPIASDKAFYSSMTTLSDVPGLQMRVENVRVPGKPPSLRLTIDALHWAVIDKVSSPLRAVPATYRAEMTFDAGSYLLEASAAVIVAADGRRFDVRTAVEDARLFSASDVPDVFSFTPPPGTLTVMGDARSLLKSLRDALFTSPEEPAAAAKTGRR